MNLEIGAAVMGPEGKLGTLTQIVIEPLEERITHVVVERAGLHPCEKLVPVEALTRSEAGRVWTRLSPQELERLPDARKVVGTCSPPESPTEVPMVEPHPVGLLWPSNVLGWYLPSRPDLSAPRLEENLPPGTHGLKPGTEVQCRDGKRVGRLDEIRYDRDSGRATSMIIRKGFFFARELEAPIDWVEAIDDRIQLRVSCDEIPERKAP